jgi:hypothetical protein
LLHVHNQLPADFCPTTVPRRALTVPLPTRHRSRSALPTLFFWQIFCGSGPFWPCRIRVRHNRSGSGSETGSDFLKKSFSQIYNVQKSFSSLVTYTCQIASKYCNMLAAGLLRIPKICLLFTWPRFGLGSGSGSKMTCARIYRPSFHENKPKTLVFT